MGFYVKPPGKNRKRFSIIHRVGGTSPQVDDPRLFALNVRLACGEDYSLIKTLVYEIKDEYQQREREKNPLLSENKAVANRYLKSIEARLELNKDAYTARREILRAVAALGSESLESIDPRALQARINAKFKGSRQRRIVRALNALLKYLKKDHRLVAAKKEPHLIRYITVDEFVAGVGKLSPTAQYLFGTLFGTGCRIGEAFALRRMVKEQFVDVSTQVTQKGEERAPKTRRGRKAAVLPEFRHYVKAWLEIPAAEKKAIRIKFQGKHWATWTRQVWDCRAHDLRHSYAVRLAELGATVTQIARNLGNSEAVVREFYLPFIQTDPEMEAMERLFSRK